MTKWAKVKRLHVNTARFAVSTFSVVQEILRIVRPHGVLSA